MNKCYLYFRHICEVCDFIARTKFDLDKHRRIHTGMILSN